MARPVKRRFCQQVAGEHELLAQMLEANYDDQERMLAQDVFDFNQAKLDELETEASIIENLMTQLEAFCPELEIREILSPLARSQEGPAVRKLRARQAFQEAKKRTLSRLSR